MAYLLLQIKTMTQYHEDQPGPHPGMRAAAEMNSQQQRSGRGGGVMTTVLPMYAVGITVYLIYTLVKVFNKKGNYEKGKEERLAKSRRYSDSLLNKRTEKQMSREERVQEFVESSQKLGELEELLSRVDDKHIDDADMRELQRRLEETESQMARIMQAMQTVTNKVNSVAEDTSDKTVEENDQTLARMKL
ncbi:hypothetical protein KUTeg_022990 [Tegillarca granosa]|uniref:Resistance to inhibitors of cholinesterase protein 3 N-terminal domain-containing protein n=1 Tax=Tegillarca granosa TaxID=220873 RepID=A0ABQ9E653_TEGGR|nr:hypothetical protein KUTeg_022990 [Tegillarca granosa]